MRRGLHRRGAVRLGISRVWVIVLAVVLVVLAVAGTWVANTFFWFGTHPPRVDYAAQLHELASKEAAAPQAANDSWEAYTESIRLVESVERDVLGPEAENARGPRARINLDAAQDPGAEASERERASRALELMESGGLPALLDRVAEAPAAARPMLEESQEREDLTPARTMAHFAAIRLKRSLDAGDDAEALRAARHGLALAVLVGRQPTLMERLLGIAIGNLTLEQVRSAVLEQPRSPAFLVGVLALTEEPLLPPIGRTLEGERLVVLGELSEMLPDSRFAPMSRGAQMEKITQYFDLAITYSAPPRPERDTALASQLGEFTSSLANANSAASMLAPAIDRFIDADDQWTAILNGTRLMLAIELRIAERGRPPESLAELVQAPLAAIPPDPFSPDGFRYRVEPNSARGYVLYSVGRDGEDNGATPYAKQAAGAFSEKGAGTDFVFVGP